MRRLLLFAGGVRVVRLGTFHIYHQAISTTFKSYLEPLLVLPPSITWDELLQLEELEARKIQSTSFQEQQ